MKMNNVLKKIKLGLLVLAAGLASQNTLADRITGVYSCTSAIVVTMDNGKRYIAIDSSHGSDKVNRFLTTAIGLMQIESYDVTLKSSGYASACGVTGTSFSEIGVK
jgi:hypothetical protein